MWRPLLLLGFCLSTLLGCATDERQVEACRHVLDTLAGGAVETTAAGSEGEGVVRLDAGALGHDHRLICRFAGPALSPRHLDLIAVELDGVAISDLSMVLLR